MKENIAKFILEAEEYPTMKELLDEFLTYSGEDIHFLIAQQELRKEGKIFYDEKHDSWLYTGGPLKGEFVRISELPAKGEEHD